MFDARDWDDIIDWEKICITEPALTATLTDEEIKNIKEKPLDVPRYPNHTQSVERCVKLVTDASKHVQCM